MKPRRTDPIIDEVRAVRQAYVARFGYDVDAIFKDLRARQAASGREYVRLPERPPVPATRSPRRPDAGPREARPRKMNTATIRLHVEELAGGRFLATSADVPGLVAEGCSVAETVEIAQNLARKIAESCIERGDPLPRALTRRHEPGAGVDLLVPVSVP